MEIEMNLNPFLSDLRADESVVVSTAPRSGDESFFLFDGPGITGMGGSNSLEAMRAHAAAGGEFIHEVRADHTLVRPERMWPGRGMDGKLTTTSGQEYSSPR